MSLIAEANIITNMRLSQTQKFILSKLMLPNETPLVSYGRIFAGKKLVANSTTLQKLGLLQIKDNEARITDRGKAVLRDAGIIDDSGTLTDDGKIFAYATDIATVQKEMNINIKPPEEPSSEMKIKDEPPPGAGASPSTSIASQSDGEARPSFESLVLINSIQEQLIQSNFIKKQQK